MSELFPKWKQLIKKRIKPTQRQMGNISKKVRELVKERSNGICERCNRQRATQMAHLIGRKQLNTVTTDRHLLHLCVACHRWLDETVEGIKYKKTLLIQDDSL